jgi:serine/threonine protein kinase
MAADLLSDCTCYILQDEIRKEAQTMSLINHPNVVKAYCSFVVDVNLWVVMPFLAGGSCLHIMKVCHWKDQLSECHLTVALANG